MKKLSHSGQPEGSALITRLIGLTGGKEAVPNHQGGSGIVVKLATCDISAQSILNSNPSQTLMVRPHNPRFPKKRQGVPVDESTDDQKLNSNDSTDVIKLLEKVNLNGDPPSPGHEAEGELSEEDAGQLLLEQEQEEQVVGRLIRKETLVTIVKVDLFNGLVMEGEAVVDTGSVLSFLGADKIKAQALELPKKLCSYPARITGISGEEVEVCGYLV